MDFRLTDEQQHLRDAARKFAQAELPALAKELEEKNEPVPADMMARYAALGYLGINLPEQYGGHGLSHLDAVIVVVIVIRYETTATACWALLFIIRAFFNDTITVAVWAGFHVRVMGKQPHPYGGQFYSVVFR